MEFDFSQHTTVKDINKVPADFRGLYVEVEGEEGQDPEFRLNSDGPTKSAVAAIQRLNNSLKKSRNDTKTAKDGQIDLSVLSEYGATPDEILEAFGTALEGAKTTKSVDFDTRLAKIKEDLAAGNKVAMEKVNTRNTALQRNLYSLLGVGAARAALEKVGVTNPDLAMPFIEQNLKTVEEDGEFRVQVIDKNGDARYSGTSGGEMSVVELVDEMKNDDTYAPLFKSEHKQGGDTKPGVRPIPGQQKTSELSATDKIKQGLRKGQHQTPGREAAANRQHS